MRDNTELKFAVSHAQPANPKLDYSRAPDAPAEPFIIVERDPDTQVYKVKGSNITSGTNWLVDYTNLAFSSWTSEVENLDSSSEEAVNFDVSTNLRWEEVELTPWEFSAPNDERLAKALGNVTFCAICLGDI